ncbi:peroxisomal membrane protein PEX16 [Suillus subaureus]|uniref:Peroxisomal membrane protein PEX16 n=1 Tax=Suillus subaureus TaxID=48587 RepID=A0A9P7EM29_9AGAM|nr:peroxisomal membrane protein PEX16 [Suillus subaureus]KAG1825891.1 peroxisomal membrane protein PEX16 [Suillus subaureus]
MSSTLEKYENFLVKNVSTISTLESSLRSVTWFLPGRFKDADLASEGLSAILHVSSMYHDTLLARVVQSDPHWKPILPIPLHTRYTRAWSDKETLYKWAARSLELIRFTQLLVEMLLRRKVSGKNRWRGIVFLETVKMILRFALLKITTRPLLSPPIPERDIDPASMPPSSTHTSPTLAPTSPLSSSPPTPDHLKNNYIPLQPNALMLAPSPPARADISVEDYLLPKALTTSSVKPSMLLMKPMSSPLEWVSECIYIIRPLVYASMLSIKKHKDKALVTAFAMELISRSLRRTPSNSADLEREEYARRDRDILWYLLRGSVWETYSRPKVEAVVEKTANTPILGVLSSIVKDWIPLVDGYYYCEYF